MDHPVLIVPGHGNSGPVHWQSIWQGSKPGLWERISVDDWDRAICEEWVAAIERRVAASGPDTLIVAHSLGCLAVVHWASRHASLIRGALLVAVPDPGSAAFPTDDSIGFSPLPMSKLGFPSTVVASTDDPYASIAFARACADVWGSSFHDIGAHGHINAASGLGEWTEGWGLLQAIG